MSNLELVSCYYPFLIFSFFVNDCSFSSGWSGLAGGGRGIEWRVSEFNIINKWNFTWSSRAIWKFNPLSLRLIIVISAYLSEHHVSGLAFSCCWNSYGQWVSSITSLIKFSLFLLGYLMFFIWDDDVSVDNCIINCRGINCWGSWCGVNSLPAFAGSNNGVWKILSQGNIWESKMLGALAIW